MHLCGKINRQTNRQTNKHLRLDCVDKPRSPALKVPRLARSVLKPLKVLSHARSVPKPLKVPSLARSVPKPLSIFAVDQWLTSVTDSCHCEVK